MAEPKHTPGPWLQRLNSRGTQFLVENEAQRRSPRAAVVRIDWWPDGNDYGLPTRGESEANARLIAAAPDLLAACEAMTGFRYEHDAFKMVIAAIDKARGKTR